MLADRLDAVAALCRRRGFAFPSEEIYGDGAAAGWDYGPLGVELQQNLRRQWWKAVVTGRDDVVGLDSAVLLPHQVLAASGHVVALRAERTGDDAPTALLGATTGTGETVYLRPEAAQGHFVNFANVMATARRRPPFGIAQIGRVFRDEQGPDDFLFHTREFDRLELSYFVEPDEDADWHAYWVRTRTDFYTGLGIAAENLRQVERAAAELPHHAHDVVDIEYRFPLPDGEWGRLEAVANRTDFDLSAHSNASGVDLSYFDQATTARYRPYCISAAAGAGRMLLAFLLDAYAEDEAPNAKGGTDRRVVLRLDRRLAPVKVAVLPVSRNAELSPRARALAEELRAHWNTDFDDAGAIGRRYRRHDEIGTPFCVTMDFDSLLDDAVTVRERDSLRQDRVAADKLTAYLAANLPGC